MVKSEKYEELGEFFQKRQIILDDIGKNDYSKEELKKLYFEYNMDKLDKILTLEMKSKEEDLLAKIKENKKRQQAMRGYNNLSTRAVFLSKEF